jgi:4-amino-4-deoxy-L-arabinose transferase-like glycosyltransferase
MIVSGNWVDPTLNGIPYDQKPPLVLWLMAASMKVVGVTPFGARLPNAILSLVGVWLTYLIGKRIAGRETGIVAGLALVTAPAYHLMVRYALMDMALLVFIAAAMYGIIGYLYEAKKYYLVITYVAGSLAFLTKGPIGVVIPMLVVGVYIVMTRRWNLIWKLGLPWGIFLIAAIVLPWYWAIYQAHGGQRLYTLFIATNFERFATTYYTRSGKTSPFYYVHVFLWAFLPWVVAMIGMMVNDFGRFRRARFDLNRISRGDPVPGLVTIWALAPIVLMSFSKSKLPQYIFFVLPAAAIIAGRYIKDYLDGSLPKRREKLFSISTAILTVVLAGLVVFVTIMFPFDRIISYIVLYTALVGLCALGLISLIKKRRAYLITALALMVGLLHLLFVLFLSPSALRYQPYKGFVADLKDADVPDKIVYFVGKKYTPSFLFYSDRKAVFVEGADLSPLEEATSAGDAAYVICPQETLPTLFDAGFSVEIVSVRDCTKKAAISVVHKKFLLRETRKDTIMPMVLARITKFGGP